MAICERCAVAASRAVRGVLLFLVCATAAPAGAAAPPAPEVPKPAPRIAGGAWAAALKDHPRLLGPKAFLQALAQAKPDAYKRLHDHNSIEAVGIVHAVEGAPRARLQPFIDTARKDIARGASDVHQDTWIWMNDVVQAYDLFYDALTPDDRRAMIEWLNAHLEKYRTDEGAFHNSTLSKMYIYLRVAYGTWGENPRAREFRDYAIRKLYEGRVLPVLLEFGAGGGFTECGWYSRGCLWHLVQALELARRMEGYDGFAKAPRFFYQRLAYEMLQPYPGLGEYGAEVYAVEGDGSFCYGGHREYPRHMRTVLAQYFRGSELARYVSAKRRKPSNPEAAIQDFLWEEEPDPPADLRTFPLAHAATGIGKVYARGDWSDDATWFRFECGDFWNAHQHFEVGNFEIYRREPLATESGEYTDYVDSHAVNYLTRTIAHNCLLVYQPDETWQRMRDGGRNKYANDGGQAHKWEWPVPTLDEWKKKRVSFQRGSLVAYDNRPEYLFVAGDCTRAYAPTKLALWIRQIVFLRPGTFIVFDRVASTRADYEKTWLLHSMAEPQIQGTRVAVTGGKGRLTVDTLLPERAVIRKVEGYTYRGQTFPAKPSAQAPLAPKWRTEVLPPEPRTQDVFLHVLQTDDEPQAARLIRKGGEVGVQVGAAQVLFSGNVGGTLTLGAKTFALKAAVVTGRYE